MKTTIANETVYFGTGSGQAGSEAPSIVFLHGAGFDHSVWVMPARYFARHGFQAVAPDLPGHGRSSGAPLETIESIADWLTQLIRVLCGGKATLVGHSMGSLVALDCASRHGDLVDAIVLPRRCRLVRRCLMPPATAIMQRSTWPIPGATAVQAAWAWRATRE